MDGRALFGGSCINLSYLADTEQTSHFRREVHRMIIKSGRFLEQCCKDLITVEWQSWDETGSMLDGYGRPLGDELRVDIMHGSVLVFLATPGIISLPKKMTPEHFHDDQPCDRLLWVRVIYVPVDRCRRGRCWITPANITIATPP